MGIVSQKLRDTARGRECTLRTSYCNNDPDTTVLAHLPSIVKGMGTKSHDWWAVFACRACHDALDLRKLPTEAELFYSHRAIYETLENHVASGLITIAGDNPKPRKPSNKIMPRKSLWQAGMSEGD